MSTETAKSLFIVSSMPRLYQALLTGVGSYQALGNRLLERIKVAHAFRQTEQVRELATILSNVPIKEYQLIGQYYLVWCSCRALQYESEALERIIDQTHIYKSQALVSRAAIAGYQADIEHEIYFYTEALKAQPTISEQIGILKSMAVIKAKEGFHQSALKGLEAIIPIVRYAEPQGYFDVLNSYAVELGEAGRKDEARNIMRVVLASPFAFAYPEWRETAEELREANRSTVAVSPSRYNVLAMPEREASEQRALQPRPARVLDLSKWKKKMAKKSNGDKTDLDITNMTAQDMAMRLLELITENRGDKAQMQKILDYTMKVFSEPRKPAQ